MTEIREKIKELLHPIADACGAFVVEVAVKNERGGKLIQAFVDTDKGITIKDCAAISRELARALDQTNLVQTSYRLEVSSPGIDKPVRMLRQFQKNVGRRFNVIYRGGKPLLGTLQNVDGETLEFRTEAGEVISIDFSEIIESKVELPW